MRSELVEIMSLTFEPFSVLMRVFCTTWIALKSAHSGSDSFEERKKVYVFVDLLICLILLFIMCLLCVTYLKKM